MDDRQWRDASTEEKLNWLRDTVKGLVEHIDGAIIPKYKRNAREPWTKDDVKELKALAKQNTPTGVLSLKLGRPPASIRSKAQREGISLKPVNRSPYNRRKAS